MDLKTQTLGTSQKVLNLKDLNIKGLLFYAYYMNDLFFGHLKRKLIDFAVLTNSLTIPSTRWTERMHLQESMTLAH